MIVMTGVADERLTIQLSYERGCQLHRAYCPELRVETVAFREDQALDDFYKQAWFIAGYILDKLPEDPRRQAAELFLQHAEDPSEIFNVCYVHRNQNTQRRPILSDKGL